jgi:hypothetical protein
MYDQEIYKNKAYVLPRSLNCNELFQYHELYNIA